MAGASSAPSSPSNRFAAVEEEAKRQKRELDAKESEERTKYKHDLENEGRVVDAFRKDYDDVYTDHVDSGNFAAHLFLCSHEHIRTINRVAKDDANFKAVLSFLSAFVGRNSGDDDVIIEGTLLTLGIKSSSGGSQAAKTMYVSLTPKYLYCYVTNKDKKGRDVIDFKQPRLEIAASTIKLVNIVNVSDAKSKDDADLDNVSKVSAAAVVGLATFLDANPACFQIHSRETSFICAAPDLLKKNQWMRVISFVASNARLAVGRAGGGLFGLSMDLAPKSYFSEFSCFDESSLAVERDAKTAGEEWERSAAKRRESFSIRAPILVC